MIPAISLGTVRLIAALDHAANVPHSFFRLPRFPPLGADYFIHPFFSGQTIQAHWLLDYGVGPVENTYALAVFFPCEYLKLSPRPTFTGQVFVHGPGAAFLTCQIEGYDLAVDYLCFGFHSGPRY